MSSVSMTHSRVSAHWLLSFRFLSIIIFIAQNLLGDDVHETSRLCTVFTGTGAGAQVRVARGSASWLSSHGRQRRVGGYEAVTGEGW